MRTAWAALAAGTTVVLLHHPLPTVVELGLKERLPGQETHRHDLLLCLVFVLMTSRCRAKEGCHIDKFPYLRAVSAGGALVETDVRGGPGGLAGMLAT